MSTFELFNEMNLGRSTDRIYEVGAQKIFSQIIQYAIDDFDLDIRAHYIKGTQKALYELLIDKSLMVIYKDTIEEVKNDKQ